MKFSGVRVEAQRPPSPDDAFVLRVQSAEGAVMSVELPNSEFVRRMCDGLNSTIQTGNVMTVEMAVLPNLTFIPDPRKDEL
jgi:hypothetical protein